MHCRNKPPHSHSHRMSILAGGALVILGTAFLLAQLGVLGVHDAWDFWPLILVLAGLLKLFGREEPGGRVWGLFLIVAGVAVQLHYLDMLQLRWKLVWPVLLICVGIFVIGSSVFRVHRRRRSGGSPNILDVFVVLGGKEDQVDSKEFEGGEIFCLMGGYELDLRDAHINQDEAVLHVRAIMGGVELRIPDTWRLTVRGTPIMGAFEDKTRPRALGAGEPEGPRLILEGSVVMGGVEIRN
jgi:cell wall-active antibiotic response 4TMS protein YvqF